jgi:hypothetical protein
MKVFVLLQQEYFPNIEGIFKTKEKAQNKKIKLQKKFEFVSPIYKIAKMRLIK